MLWPVLLLTFNATIFDKMASGAVLQLDIIDSSNAAEGAHVRSIFSFVIYAHSLPHRCKNVLQLQKDNDPRRHSTTFDMAGTRVSRGEIAHRVLCNRVGAMFLSQKVRHSPSLSRNKIHFQDAHDNDIAAEAALQFTAVKTAATLPWHQQQKQ